MHPSAGGPPVVVENFIRETKRLGHLSEIVSTPLFCQGDENALVQRLNELAPTSFVSPFAIPGLLRGPVRQQVARSVQNADVVHLHTLWNPINVLVRQECRRSLRPYVLMPHGMLDPYSLKVKRLQKSLYFWMVERANIIAARRLIYTTPEEARLVAAQFSSLPRGVVIPLGGDAPFEDSEQLAREFFARFPTAQNRRVLLFLGRLHFKKGIDRILRSLPAVASAIPDVLLLIVGDGEPAYEAKLKASIQAQELEGHVLMTGRLSGRQKWAAYAAARLFLLPSRQENFAITVAEAMHMGLPVVISDRVNTWPYVEDADAGLVLEEREIDDLGNRVIPLLRDDSRLASMGARGRDYARRNLTWSGAAIRLLDCYNEILGRVCIRNT